MRDPALRDELVLMAEQELAAADALFAALDVDRRLEAELEARLGGPLAPLILALDGWDGAPPEAADLLAVNDTNTTRFAELVAEGWPGLRIVGPDGADAAWLLAQHADRANEERRSWLPALADAVATGDADPRHLSTLTDRVAVVAGEPQRYGEILGLASDGAPELLVEVEDPGHLEERRAAIGLPSLAAMAPWLAEGDLVPYGPDRGSVPVNQWPMVVEGHVSAEAALEAGVRHVHRIWAVRPGDRRLGRLRAIARERGVMIEAVEADVIDELAAGRSHGGVIGLVGARRDRRIGDVLAEVGEGSLTVMLDGVEDPFNFGQAVRALYAAGVDALVVRRSWETALGTVTRASAGASELLPTATVSSVDEAVVAARGADLRVLAASADVERATDLHDVDLRGGVLLLIGGERRGITRSIGNAVDELVRIPYGRERAPELGAAAAAAIIGFEALRQRRDG